MIIGNDASGARQITYIDFIQYTIDSDTSSTDMLNDLQAT